MLDKKKRVEILKAAALKLPMHGADIAAERVLGLSAELFRMYSACVVPSYEMGLRENFRDDLPIETEARFALVKIFMEYIGDLEIKARRYNLLIDAEKKNSEELAAK